MTKENYDIRVYREISGEDMEKIYTINSNELYQFMYTFIGDVAKMEKGDFVVIPYPLYTNTDASIILTKEYNKVKTTFYWRTNIYEYQSFDYYVDTFDEWCDILSDWNIELEAAEQLNKEHILSANKHYMGKKHYLSKIS